MQERSKRTQRVERELFESLSSFLLHSVHAPLPCYAAITAVEVHPNLRHAKVHFRLVGQAIAVAQAKSMLDDERSNFQRHVARHVPMKFCPVLRFEYGVAEQLDPIDLLLEKMQRRSEIWS